MTGRCVPAGVVAGGDHLGDVFAITLRRMLFVLLRKMSRILPSVPQPAFGLFRTHIIHSVFMARIYMVRVSRSARLRLRYRSPKWPTDIGSRTVSGSPCSTRKTSTKREHGRRIYPIRFPATATARFRHRPTKIDGFPKPSQSPLNPGLGADGGAKRLERTDEKRTTSQVLFVSGGDYRTYCRYLVKVPGCVCQVKGTRYLRQVGPTACSLTAHG